MVASGCRPMLPFSVFLFGCVPVRLALAILVVRWSGLPLKSAAFVATMVSVGFTVIYVMGWRRQTGTETMGCKICTDPCISYVHASASGGIICGPCTAYC